MMAEQKQTDAERAAIFLKEHKAHTQYPGGNFEITGAGSFWNHSGIAHKPPKTPPSMGSDPGDGSKA
jgi:hypothetical protein